ncbi:Tn3 family transposase [Streptomyces sp. SAI-041]|uniref:Tn3 family transposase n=1 Tax=Streptomyces sp. SAI-041 TaxID=2940548 RepID=UPI002475341A|nr:Tn3 family transposase [Streptomyces sp. SAI-041]
MKEYGALRRTVYAARYLADETYRRKIARQLNKGESLHSLCRDLHYAHQREIRERFLAGQSEQAWCLTVLTNSVVTWTTEYYGLAVAQMRAEGRAVDDELLAHISPAHSENVNYHGTIHVEVDTERAKLDRPATGRCVPNGRNVHRPGERSALGHADAGFSLIRSWAGSGSSPAGSRGHNAGSSPRSPTSPNPGGWPLGDVRRRDANRAADEAIEVFDMLKSDLARTPAKCQWWPIASRP